MNGCSLSDANIKRKLLDKGLEIARKVNPRFQLNRLQEIILVPDPANKFEKEIYQLRSIADRAERRITKELDIPINVFGRVFGARSYSDAAAIEIVITPQIRKAYEAKQELITEEQAVEEIKKTNLEQAKITPTYGPSTAYRPQGFYKGDRALFEQELRDLENAMDEVSDISEATILEDTETKFEPPVTTPVQLEFKFSPEQPNQKGNLDDLGFEEVSCNV